MPEHECCETCRFYIKNPNCQSLGLCRRRPPCGRTFPDTSPADWCGEYLSATYQGGVPCQTCNCCSTATGNLVVQYYGVTGLSFIEGTPPTGIGNPQRKICRTCVNWRTGMPAVDDDQGCCFCNVSVRTEVSRKVAEVTMTVGDDSCVLWKGE